MSGYVLSRRLASVTPGSPRVLTLLLKRITYPPALINRRDRRGGEEERHRYTPVGRFLALCG